MRWVPIAGRAHTKVLAVAVVTITIACGSSRRDPDRTCPARALAPALLPRVDREESTLEHWLARSPDLDVPLLSLEAIAAHEQALAARGRGGRGDEVLLEVPGEAELLARLQFRLDPLHEAVRQGRLVGAGGARLDAREVAELAAPSSLGLLAPELRIALEHVPIRCSPRSGALYRLPIDRRFDRNLCSTLQPQEPLQTLLRWRNGSTLVRTRYVIGWIDDASALSPPLSIIDAQDWFRSEPALIASPHTLGATPIASYTRLPSPPGEVLVASAHGLERVMRPAGAIALPRPLTRRGVLEAAFARLGDRYGWAGAGGGRDCSQLVQEIFASFGLHLPRNSGEQAHAGTSRIELAPSDGHDARERALDEAQRRGIVLLHLPGHVMLYLGRARGRAMALHALAEYVEPCEGGGETLRVVDRVAVSDLELGRGSSRGSLLERITDLAIFGR